MKVRIQLLLLFVWLLPLASDAAAADQDGCASGVHRISFYRDGLLEREEDGCRSHPVSRVDANWRRVVVDVPVVRVEAITRDSRIVEIHEYDKDGKSIFRTYGARP